jgi:hypothetical protein
LRYKVHSDFCRLAFRVPPSLSTRRHSLEATT